MKQTLRGCVFNTNSNKDNLQAHFPPGVHCKNNIMDITNWIHWMIYFYCSRAFSLPFTDYCSNYVFVSPVYFLSEEVLFPLKHAWSRWTWNWVWTVTVLQGNLKLVLCCQGKTGIKKMQERHMVQSILWLQREQWEVSDLPRVTSLESASVGYEVCKFK